MATGPLIAYADGGCRGNPGPGAWGFLLIDLHSGVALERTGGDRNTTNNRMEISAALGALEALKQPSAIEIRTDSRYLIDSATKWMAGWKRAGWRRKGNAPVANVELLQRLDVLLAVHQVRWKWVAGHAGEPGNEYVDGLCNTAMDRLIRGGDPASERRHATPPVALREFDSQRPSSGALPPSR